MDLFLISILFGIHMIVGAIGYRLGRINTEAKNLPPMQPLVKTSDSTIRFKSNKIIEYLFDNGHIDLNLLATMKFSPEDRMQFAQLLGYSVIGYSDLPYVSDENYERAHDLMEKLL